MTDVRGEKMAGYLHSERRAAIVARLGTEGRVLAVDLAREFDTSEDTIRRDLRALAAAGQCRRVYGGALSVAPDLGPISARAAVGRGVKAALGAALARLIQPGMVVFIDAGSTNLACARMIPPLGATLVTHAPAIAAVLAEQPGNTLLVLGGRIDPVVGAAIGARALGEIEGMRPDLVLIGACGLDVEAGMTVHSMEDAAFKRSVAARSGAVATAVARDKIGAAASFAVMGVEACDTLVLEAGLAPEIVARLAAMGPEIIEVECGI